MLETIMGRVSVLVNGLPIEYTSVKLPNKTKLFSVDERYKISFDCPKGSDVSCKLIIINDEDVKECIESGESLALISFYNGNIKLSIGIEENPLNDEYHYAENGLSFRHNSNSRVCFYIAWLVMKEPEVEDVFTWFAADPTIDGNI